MFVESCAAHQLEEGKHTDPTENSLLIQIANPEEEFVKPLFKFKEVYKFKFLDLEEYDKNSEYAISDFQALEIAKILIHAKFNKMNVIVSCTTGLCRSASIVDAAISLGFDELKKGRFPNIYIKTKIFKYFNQLKFGHENK